MYVMVPWHPGAAMAAVSVAAPCRAWSEAKRGQAPYPQRKARDAPARARRGSQRARARAAQGVWVARGGSLFLRLSPYRSQKENKNQKFRKLEKG